MGSRRRARPAGFTLVELLVVVLIIGILTAMGMTQYSKAVETSKADQALALAQSIATAHRMFYLEKGSFLDGNISACDPTAAAASANCATSPCDLMYCNYLARQDLQNKPYIYLVGNSACGLGIFGCAKRRTGAGPGTDALPFATWSYNVSNAGVASAQGGAPSPP